MRKAIAMAALAAGSLTLGGCHSLLTTLGFAPKPTAPQLATLDMSDYFQSLVDTGKAQLKAGLLSQALVSFRQASYDPAHAAEAYNGLGVAYAELGRDDLAARYFGQALEIDPSDARFARNLARLDDKGDTALAQASPPAELPAVAAAAAPAPANAVPVSAAPVEVAISSALSANAARPAEVMVSSQGQTLALANAPVVQGLTLARVTAPGLHPSKGAEPVRVATNDAAPPARAAYPVRIDLTKLK